jgi:uncharacterized protein (TIGR00730 family)
VRVTVYASSSDALAPVYTQAAYDLGRELAGHGHTLVSGGGRVGLMGAVARGVRDHGGHTTAILPEFMRVADVHDTDAHDIVWTDGMRARKHELEHRADAFIALPGGIGTLEEIAEILTLKGLAQHTKNLVLLNTNGFYTRLMDLLQSFVTERFAKPSLLSLVDLVATPAEAVVSIERPEGPAAERKWF